MGPFLVSRLRCFIVEGAVRCGLRSWMVGMRVVVALLLCLAAGVGARAAQDVGGFPEERAWCGRWSLSSRFSTRTYATGWPICNRNRHN